MKNVKIMRGVPGSGKSFYRYKHFKPHSLVSTDSLFYNEEGEYKFDATKLPVFHNATLQKFAFMVTNHHPFIVVDNTNIRMYELAPYYRLAEAFGYDVEIVNLVAPLETCIRRNVHRVPEDIIRNMMHSMEPIPTWWSQTTVFNY